MKTICASAPTRVVAAQVKPKAVKPAPQFKVQVGQAAAAFAVAAVMVFNTVPAASADTIKEKICASNPTALICTKTQPTEGSQTK